MANYSFTIEEGTFTSFSINVFGLLAGMDVKVYFRQAGWVEQSGINASTETNRISITIPGNLATSGNLPARYRVLVSADDWETSSVVLSGQIFFKAFSPQEPSIDISKGEAGGVAALDDEGDVINADQNKVMPIVVLNSGDPTPSGLRDNTLIVELA